MEKRDDSGNKKYGESRKHKVASLGATQVLPLLSFHLGSAWLAKSDPPRHQPCEPRWRRPLPPPPPPLPATAIVAVWRRCWPLPLPPPAAGSTGHFRRLRQAPPPPSATPAADRHCLWLLQLLPSAATSVSSGLCHNKWIYSIFVRNKTTNSYLYFAITPFNHPPFHHCTISQF